MFSTDYPHIEGGRNPLSRFDASMSKLDDEHRRMFFFDNFVDLMGDVMIRRGLPTRWAPGADLTPRR